MLSNTIMSWWTGLEGRERNLLLAGAVFSVAAGLYTLVFPMFEMHAAASEEAVTADRDYHWLKEQVRALEQVRDAAGGVLPVTLPAGVVRDKIEKDLQGRNFRQTIEIESTGTSERVKVIFERVQGEQLMGWLEELVNNGYAIAEIKLRNSNGRLTGTVAIEV